MRIGIDIDDTVTNTTELMIKYAKKYFETNDENEVHKILTSLIEGKLLDFYTENLANMIKEYEIKTNVKYVIDTLREKGHYLVVITARGTSIQKDIIENTLEYFRKHGLVFDDVLFKTARKYIGCLDQKIDLMIDDSFKELELIKENCANTIPLLFTSESNKDIETDIPRVNNWMDIKKYVDGLEAKKLPL